MNERLESLLERWEKAAAHGVFIPPDELCPDDPALVAVLAQRVAVLRRMGELVLPRDEET
ncbi:MAG: hypothetical protein K2W96_04120 [Gemmataceae bacterium]|nr:hypothetical protein [Gemmataceae bacterium]